MRGYTFCCNVSSIKFFACFNFINKILKNQSAVTNYDAAVKRTQSRIFTVMEEEAEHHQDLTSSLKLANMPDVVKDTMKISAELRSDDLAHVNVSARIVDDCPLPANISHSADNLENSDISPIRYALLLFNLTWCKNNYYRKFNDGAVVIILKLFFIFFFFDNIASYS